MPSTEEPVNQHVLFGDEDEVDAQPHTADPRAEVWDSVHTLYGQLLTTLEIARARFTAAEGDVIIRHELAGDFDELEVYARAVAKYLRFAPTRRES